MRWPRAVVVFGFVSLLNDAASEMIAPLLPVFLTAALGAGGIVVGLVEGVAEATASVLKYAAGRSADLTGGAKRLVVGGYGLSNVVRPLLALASAWETVLGLRFLDRVGKGLRTAPRDAWIAAVVPAEQRGRAFGFQRAMDHGGATLGPLVAAALLAAGLALGDVFLWSAVPGVLLLLLLVVGLPPTPPRTAAPPSRLAWREIDPRLRALVLGAGAVAFAAAPEAFLVLWASDRGIPTPVVPLLWAAAHVVKATLAAMGGAWADRFGRLPVFASAWGLRAVVLVVLGLAPHGTAVVWPLFLAFAGASALGEAAERAWLGDLAPPGGRGGVLGLYHMAVGLAALPGAIVFGALWQWGGPSLAFLLAAGLTALATLLLLALARAGGLLGSR